MCGIAGCIAGRPTNAATLRETAERMARRLAHRGPDDSGVWIDQDAGVAIGHRRLSIIDPGPAGAQPMVSADGRYVLAYNGEVYNAPELARTLRAQGVRFRGHCDTEVVAEACAAWGVAGATERLSGMFAFAVWDRDERRLSLVRDRIGIKPMYWACTEGRLLFGSEIKALEAHPNLQLRIDPGAVAAYLRFGYVPAPASIFEGVRKLEPGCVLRWRPGETPEIERYWDLRSVIREGQSHRLAMTDDEALDTLESLLADVVRSHMVSDVPIGCLLSGGIDSSLVAMMMQSQSGRPIRTFSVGFHETGFDEAAHAREIARRLGTDHTEIYVDPAAAIETIPHLAERYDEPFADASQIPTGIIAELARKHVKVALSGDGGDEVFGGYNRYLWADTIERTMRIVPAPARRLGAAALRRVPPSVIESALAILPGANRPARVDEQLEKLCEIVALPDPGSIYGRLVSQWPDPAAAITAAHEPPDRFDPPPPDPAIRDPAERMQYLDSITYLPDDILTKVDRASMAVGLELRVPLLDPRIIAIAWRVRRADKIRGRRGKIPLRRLLYRRLPPHLLDRPKQGFALPLGDWLRGPLRPWAEDLLAEDTIRATGFLEPSVIRSRWAEHISGKRDRSHAIWTVLMFITWLTRHAGTPRAS